MNTEMRTNTEMQMNLKTIGVDGHVDAHETHLQRLPGAR